MARPRPAATAAVVRTAPGLTRAPPALASELVVEKRGAREQIRQGPILGDSVNYAF